MPKPSPTQELSQQPLPTGQDNPFSGISGSWKDLYCPPPIPPSAADVARRFRPIPENAQPNQLFSMRRNLCTYCGYRFIRKNNHKQALMFVDGAASNNGAPDAQAGCGVVYTSIQEAPGISLPLEKDGKRQTNNRAELRAALLAMGLRHWSGEGFDKVVLACDSEYVVLGATEWVRKWENNGWKKSNGEEVKNRDLWEALRRELRRMERNGVLVQFWLIPREWNEADAYAKKATTTRVSGMRESIQRMEIIPSTKQPALISMGEYGVEPNFDDPGSPHNSQSSSERFEADTHASQSAKATTEPVHERVERTGYARVVETGEIDSSSRSPYAHGSKSSAWLTRGEMLAEEYGFTSTGDDEMDMMIAIGLRDMQERGEID